jgi:hypothetical protein
MRPVVEVRRGAFERVSYIIHVSRSSGLVRALNALANTPDIAYETTVAMAAAASA